MENPLPAKWTKKDYLDTAKTLGVLGFDLGVIGLGAYIGHAIDCEVGGGDLFTLFGAITAGVLVAARYD